MIVLPVAHARYKRRMWVHSLVDADASCGGKAVGLARLIAAGAHVPAGFVIDVRAFTTIRGELAFDDVDNIGHALAAAADRVATTPIPPELADEVARAIAALGGELFVVRSSATIEDREVGAAAGVFSSRRAIAAVDLWPAIRAVWSSALTPLAASYAHEAVAIGVIVQRFIPGERITIYTRPAGAPTGPDLWIQRGTDLQILPRPESRSPKPVSEAAASEPLISAALLAESAIHAAATGADVELVIESSAANAIWTVQARALIHPRLRDRRAAPPMLTAALVADGRRWTFDLAHNPDPLSPAQHGLVELIDRAAIAPWSLRVCGGYLYSAARSSTNIDVPHAPLPPPPTPPRDRADLLARATALETRLATALGMSPSLDIAPAPLRDADLPSLPDALARYVEFYAIWSSELSPLIAVARNHGSHRVGARPSAVESTLASAARGELTEAIAFARLGALAPCWDIATPTFAERPALLRDAIARAAALIGSKSAPATDADDATHTTGVPDDRTDLADLAADLAERDDLWFARAQQLVRRALLAHAIALGLDADDACWLPLDELAALPPTPTAALDRDTAHRRAAAARTATERAATWEMPAIVHAGGLAAEPAARDALALHGHGTGGTITGRVVRFASLASAIAVGAGDVVVTRAVTPALAVLVTGCAALVSETGGLLDHGAAMARELGIPCVVGCTGAWSDLPDGALVRVDGARGQVALVAR